MHKSVNTIFKTHYVLIVKYIYNLGVHAHLSKCWKVYMVRERLGTPGLKQQN